MSRPQTLLELIQAAPADRTAIVLPEQGIHVSYAQFRDQVQAMADAAAKRFGRIDILVNNAALRREKPFAEMSHAEWREIMDVTLDGAFHCVKACLPALKKSGAGTVVNIGGLSAHTGAKHRAHVVTAKAGLIGFTRAYARLDACASCESNSRSDSFPSR